jgi:hypothetical protein
MLAVTIARLIIVVAGRIIVARAAVVIITVVVIAVVAARRDGRADGEPGDTGDDRGPGIAATVAVIITLRFGGRGDASATPSPTLVRTLVMTNLLK